MPARIREWAAQEVSGGRLLPWFAVAYGFGIVLYFTAEREPAWWAATGLAVVCATCAIAVRRRLVAFVLMLGLFAIAAGFAVATIKTALIDHPVLRFPASGVVIAGFVELREESQHTDRFVLRVEHIEGTRIEGKPRRVRLSVKRGMAPPAGSFVEVKALLDPPLQPLAPNSYDFARDLFFQRIGASGFVRGPVKVIAAPAQQSLPARTDAIVQRLRDAIDARIRSVVPGDPGAIASMLLTGKRDAIAANVYDAMFISGIGHVLSISGYHMAVVAGVVFFIVRALLALIPGLADRAPIKKWAAFAALVVTAFYLVLSGAEVATQRSFIMIAVVLIGVLLDRPTLTMRTLTVAALLVLVLAPEAVVHPSFQMSFAATLALIATYARGVPRARAATDTSPGARAALWGMNEISSLVIASLVAGLATTPYAAYHFHRIAPYGVVANLLAMPVVSACHADGNSWHPRHSIWFRRRMLAANGLRHRMDGCGGAVGRAPSRRVWPSHLVRDRTAFARDRWPSRNRTTQDAASLERRAAHCTCGDRSGENSGARHSDRRGWADIRGSRSGWEARHSPYWGRHVCDA